MKDSNKISAKAELRETEKRFRKAMVEHNKEEWAGLIKKYNNNVFVFRSDLNNSDFGNTLIVRKVTVVGVVKSLEDGTYTLQIGWSRCSHEDKYIKTVGNLVAARRADNPSLDFEMDGRTFTAKTIPGFLSDRGAIKQVFFCIAKGIVDTFEDAYDREEGELILPDTRLYGLVVQDLAGTK